jgi:putative ABC transport system permease protein
MIPLFGRTVTVIGVVNHVPVYDLHRDGRPQIYVRAEDFHARTLFWAVKTAQPAAMIAQVEAAVRALDPRIAVVQLRTMDEIVGESLNEQRISAVLIGGFAVGALLLAAMGLFGVVSGAVTRRRHELPCGSPWARIIRPCCDWW